jgi:hypothetical protein
MTRGVRLYLVGSFVLVSLAGCGRGFFQAEREPWRAEAEIACLKSGEVKETADVVRIEPISGPGMCGADYPLKVSALGETPGSFGFADEPPRPPGSIGGQPRWPIAPPPAAYPQGQAYPPSQIDAQPLPPPQGAAYPQTPAYPASQAYPPSPPYAQAPAQQGGYGAPGAPISLSAPGVVPQQGEIDLPPDGAPGQDFRPPYASPPRYPPRDRYAPPYPQASYPQVAAPPPLPRLGPARGEPVDSVGPVAVKPAATLACPIVSALDHWLNESVQPSAMRWFGARVVEIKQISAYSCRGMNGNPHAHISEHAFGNALDIAAFTLADGRRITVKDGWHGLPEEQGFLHDVQGSACRQFSTVLAPGSNRYHYDHIHVDLMRRASRRLICEPDAVSGEEVAARAAGRNPYASREPFVTGSLGGKHAAAQRKRAKIDEEDEFEDE